MKSKLPNKKNKEKNILSDILIGLPFPILGGVILLLENNLNISLNPLKKYFVYVIFAYYPAIKLYGFLTPLHEIGHYLIAVYLKKKYTLDVNIWMDKNHTFCSKWKAYENKGAKVILCAGVFFKIIYCIVIIVIFLIFNIKFGIILYSIIIWMEVVLNCFPIIKESDGYKLRHLDAFFNEFFNEKKRRLNKEEELYIKQKYPWLLLTISIGTIFLFYFVDKFLLFSESYVINFFG